MRACCTASPTGELWPCATHLAEGDADYSVLICPPHVITCIPNYGDQDLVGAVGRAVIERGTQ